MGAGRGTKRVHAGAHRAGEGTSLHWRVPLRTSARRLARYGRRVILATVGPLWLRVLITIGAAALFGVLAWRYYAHYWRR